MILAARARRLRRKLGDHLPGSERRPTMWRPELPPPHAAQKEVLREHARFNVINCGRRWGKTTLGSWLVIEPSLDGYPTAWFAPDYKALSEVWREVCRLLRPITVKRDAQQHKLELSTGGVIDFWSLDSDPEACRGRKYQRVVLDEAAKARHLKLAWEMAIRPTLVDFKGDAWFLSTPRGRDYYWEMWWRGNSENPERDPEYSSWQMPTWTNPHIPADEVDAMRRELPSSTFSQEIEAQFLEVGGRYFDEWYEDKHVILPHDIPEHFRFIGGLDFGTANPFAFVLCAIDESNKLLVVDEAYGEGMLPREQARKILECYRRFGIKNTQDVVVAADPAMFPPRDPSKRIGEYPIEAFWREGIRAIPAINNRVVGWTRLKELMHSDDLLVFKGRCSNLIRTIPLMIRDDKNPEDLDTSLEDHALDALRYAALVRTEASQAIIERVMPRFATITEQYLARQNQKTDIV